MTRQEIQKYKTDKLVRNATIYMACAVALTVVVMCVAMQYAGVR